MQVLLVDDHALFREGLALLLQGLDPAVGVTHAATAEAALVAAAAHGFDLVLLDLALPGRPGLDVLYALHRDGEGPPVVVMSGSDDRATVMAALQAGAMGFVPKSSPSAVMIGALRVVLGGGIYLPPDVFLGDAGSRKTASDAKPGLALTPRQWQVLRLILEGRSIKLIAQALDTSANTTKTHVSAVLRALGVTSRTQAIVAVHRLGLRVPPAP